MRKLFENGLILACLMVLAGCGDQLRKEVVSSYGNGQPAKVYYYDKENQWVREESYHDNGLLMMEGAIVDGLREGEWVSYFPDGKVQSKGFFHEGIREGKSLVYYENGHLWMDGFYNNDRKCGEWIFYDEQGYEIERRNFGPCD